MNREKETEKRIAKYAALYAAALKEKGYPDAAERRDSYIRRLTAMYASPAYREHDVYPTVRTDLVYAVIAMCLELKEHGMSDSEIPAFSDIVFRARKKAFAALEKAVDLLPDSYAVAERWNRKDHEKRVRDKSLTYDFFHVEEGRIEYRITRCAYVEMFEYYGIRPLCRIFCRTDEAAYANLTRGVKFTRYSDLSYGDCCHDMVERKRRK